MTAHPVDLTNCDREPIHIPGAIQPHGVLLVVDEATLAIQQASTNVALHLGLDLEHVLSAPLASVLDPAAAALVAAALAEANMKAVNPVRLNVRGARYDAILHKHAGICLIELEPAPADDPAVHHLLRAALEEVQGARSLDALGDVLVREVARITGFERVMFYRFDEHGHGSVDAEARRTTLEPFLGLHYPASDIPKQARQLYLKNWLRLIPDATYTPVPVVPAGRPDTGAPLDLTYSVLRSVSPVHLEYMANIGIRASMSISLIVHDQLWGLISCAHHSGPRHIRYEMRSACEVLGRLASLQIAALEDRSAETERRARRGTLAAIADAIRASDGDTDVLAAMLARPRELVDLVGASGVAVVGAGEPRTHGRTPPARAILLLASWLEQQGDLDVQATSSLSAQLPAAAEIADVASGLLAFTLPGTPTRRLLWFRPEMVRTVTWGGDPEKPAITGPSEQLHPRRSFAMWKQEVHAQSRPWTTADLEAADELRHHVVELDLARQVDRERRAVQSRDDLVAVVSHDLRNPLNVIEMAASVLRSTLPDSSEPAARSWRANVDRIHRSSERASKLITELLDLAKLEAGRFALTRQPERADEIVEETLTIMRPLAEQGQVEIRVEHAAPGALIDVDRDRIFQVLANLLSNAIKFTPGGGAIRVSTEVRASRFQFSVADTGRGIPADELPHVFDRYWRVRQGNREGSGLGLFIARGIVEAHGGRLWAESAAGSGTTMYFTVELA